MFNIVMIVCCCRAVSERQIVGAIQGGAHSVEAVAACTEAGTKCGSCRSEIAALVAAHGPDAKRHLAMANADSEAA
jgi:NAD(P)H-nitrite reductase large subunit